MRRKTRTMYLHTLDGKPASYTGWPEPAVYFVDGRNRATLVPSLRALRTAQRLAQVDALKHPNTYEWSETSRYGYVLVEVPA